VFWWWISSVALFVLGWDCLLSLAISNSFVVIGVVRMRPMVFLRRQKFGLSLFFSSTYASVWTSTSFLFFRPFDSEWNHWLGLVRNGHIHVLLFGPVLVFVWSSTSINDLCWFLLQLYVISLNSFVWLHPWFVSVGVYLDCKQRLWMYDEHFILTHASHSEQKWYWSLG
jgi:hypothetical protein